jgi:DNA-binding GntR family transcriptional regulator
MYQSILKFWIPVARLDTFLDNGFRLMNLQAFAHVLETKQGSKPVVVSDVLREAILGSVLRGGEKLKQAEIAQQLKVSRMPVREALKQLEAEGLVASYPNRGSFVAAYTASEAQELYEMRLALEPLALRLSLPRLSKSNLGRAEDLIDEADHETDPRKWSELNWYFHEALYSRAERPRLLNMIRSLYISADRYTRTALFTLQKQQASQSEHRDLLETCRRHDVVGAVTLLENHIRISAENLVAFLQQQAP